MGSSLTFNINAGESADIRIELDPSLPDDVGGQDATNGLSFGVLKLNPRWKASSLFSSQNLFSWIVLHEVGHIVGFGHLLDDGCTMADTVMKDELPGTTTSWATLTCGDRAAADRKYRGDETPIVLSINGGRPRFSDIQNGVLFNLTGSCKQQIAWPVDEDAAWLFLDRNGNGTVDDGTELFGNFTPTSSGAAASNGYEALADLDENQDAVIDQHDRVYWHLQLWFDRDRNGLSESNELVSLLDAGVEGLDVVPHLSKFTDQNGNGFRLRAKVYGAVGHWSFDVVVAHGACATVSQR
jgi:hypothetical protein